MPDLIQERVGAWTRRWFGDELGDAGLSILILFLAVFVILLATRRVIVQ